jgi:fluoroquinolone resistance protein
MSFIKSTYYKEKFTALSFTVEKVETVTFDECIFTDCRFVDCKFEKCVFIECEFQQSVFSAIDPIGSRLLHPEFFQCKVIGVDWSKASKLENMSFTECQIDYSNFSSLQLPRTKMVNCSAKEVRFTETNLSDGVLTDTDFQESTFFKTNLSRADFRRAKNYNIDVTNNIIRSARFSLPEALSLLYGLDIVIE